MFKKIGAYFSRHKKLLSVSVMSALASCMCVMSAFAAEGDPVVVDVSTLMTTSAQKIVNDLLSMISGILPICITVFGVGVAITYGYKFIKRIVSK